MNDLQPLILMVEDEPGIRQILRVALEGRRYRCMEAVNGHEGMALAAECRPDAVLLDLGLPDMDGLDLLSRLREWSRMPVLVISARGREIDKVAAFDSGADDYVSKPFNTSEVLARIRCMLRRPRYPRDEGPEVSVFVLDRWLVDLPQRQVRVDGREVRLSPFEFAVLSALIRHAGRIVTHGYLLKEVWGEPRAEWLVHLRLCMFQLRHKLEKEPSRPRYLRTETGVGYRLWIAH